MDGIPMGLFPADREMISGVIVTGENYKLSSDGVVIFFNGGNDLRAILDRVGINKGKIIVAKSLIDEESG